MTENERNYLTTTQEVRALIIRRVVDEGEKISKVLRIVGLSESTVRRIVSKYNATNSYLAGIKGGLKPSGLNDELISSIEILMNDNNVYNLH
jgi:transposase